EEENLAVALAADDEEYDEDYEDDSGWNVDEEEELAEADEFAEEDEYEYVEVDEDEEDTEYAEAEDVEGESLAETELAVAAENIVTRAVTVTESVPVTEAYLAQETSENIEFTLAFLEDLSERYGLTLAEQDYYTLIIAETLYDDTPERKAHAFGRLTVTDEDNKVFTTQARSWTDNSRSGAFDNNARLRRYLIPVNTTLQFKYRSGNTALSMIDCDELYPNPLLNYELDGTIGSLKVTKLEMNNNYAIHIRAGWGSADAGRPVRLVNVN
ncbi:MAG: hypothetical protein LBD62_02395, partial [Candidatus Margulisbacteria bacterium]|nr:hypothetical protein [Candidatus Margulisiibacteriota bacterium]